MSSIITAKTRTLVKELKTVLINYHRFKIVRSASTMSSTDSFPKTLEGFGYGFNSEGKLRKINKDTGEITDQGFVFEISKDPVLNQKHYEALGETITEHVYELLEKNGMHRIYIPDDIPNDEATFIFCTQKNLDKPKKLMVLIHGSGVVRAGQWARSLIINQSLDHGTQLPYLKTAKKLGYEVLIMNTNDNYRIKNDKKHTIPGHGSPISHATSVWKKFVIGTNPEAVSIVAHSYGGVVTIDLARKFPEFFKEKVFAIGFTDSVHSMSVVNDEVRNILRNICRNWVASSKPLNEKIPISDNEIPCYSAGHTKHEWTSYSCLSALFDYFESKYEEFTEMIAAKRLKRDS